MWLSEDRYPYKYSCASFRNPLRPHIADNQMIKIIVILIIAMTICSCSAKIKVSCDMNSKEETIQQCKETPQFGIAIPF